MFVDYVSRYPEVMHPYCSWDAIFRRGGAGGAGGAIAPPNIEVGGLSPPLRYHQVLIASACSSRLAAVLSVTVSINRVSLASQTSIDGDQGKYDFSWSPVHCNRSSTSITGLRDY